MSILGFLKKKPSLDDTMIRSRPTGRGDKSYSLTADGKKKAEDMMLKSPYFEVLANIPSDTTTTISDLSQATGWPTSKVEIILNKLISRGLVKLTKI